MNTRLIFLTLAGALALSACGNKGPLVKVDSASPDSETPAADTPAGDVPVQIISAETTGIPADGTTTGDPAVDPAVDAADTGDGDDGTPDDGSLPPTGG